MNANLSIVLISKNEAKNIASCLEACKSLSNDIWLIDSFSTDKTIEIAEEFKVNIRHQKWLGYGATKNLGNSFCKNDWILSLDADEFLQDKLIHEIDKIDFSTRQENTVFYLKRKLIFLNKTLNFGSVANEYRPRIFNRKKMMWNDNSVHEELEFIDKSEKEIKQKIDGFMLHNSFKNIEDYKEKMNHYALLSAENKKASVLKLIFSPIISFIKNYIFRLGFLDGKAGFEFAYYSSYYAFKKYYFAFKKA